MNFFKGHHDGERGYNIYNKVGELVPSWPEELAIWPL